MPEHKGAAGNR